MKIHKHTNIHIIEGVNPVLISAPHTRPIIKKDAKSNFIKPREIRIAQLVKEVCRQTGSWGILTRGKGKIDNWAEVQRVYQKNTKRIIRSQNVSLFFDVHGCKASRPFALDYDFKMPHLHPHDTFLKHSLLKHFREAFPNQKISTGFFKTNNGVGNDTMTYFVRKNFELPAIQLEINKKIRENNFDTLVEVFTAIINDYNIFTHNLRPKNQLRVKL